LREFFLAYLKSGRKSVAMLSQVVDDLGLSSNRSQKSSLRRTWWFCCTEENINPKKPTRMPLLFAIDTKLGVPGGFRYVLSCDGVRRQSHDFSLPVNCCEDFSSPSFDGTTDGFGDSHTGHDGDSGCSGCTADGCGGGD